MNLKQLETQARRTGSASQMINGEEFEITRKGKPGSRRVNYRHGSRHLGRDQAERLFPEGEEGSSTRYEWDAETVDPATGDILDHSHAECLKQLLPLQANQRLVLVRDVGNDDDGITDRCWAYVQNNELPEHFSDENDRPTFKVPRRFIEKLRGALSGGQGSTAA